MKTILLLVALVAIVGCANLRQAQQVEMVEARVVKIDTIFRYPKHMKQLTWQDRDDIRYITYVSMYNEIFAVGSSMYVMRQR